MNALDRFNNLVTRFSRPSLERNPEDEAAEQMELVREQQRLAALREWASHDIADSEFLPWLDAEIDRCEQEQEKNVESQAQMILYQGTIRGLKSVRRMFQTWRSTPSAEE